jgi:hypothetical protein
VLVPARDWRFESSLGHNRTKEQGCLFLFVKSLFFVISTSCRILLCMWHTARLAQLVRASRLHRGGRGFESLSVHRQSYYDGFARHTPGMLHEQYRECGASPPLPTGNFRIIRMTVFTVCVKSCTLLSVFRLGSSVVEQRTENPRVDSSILSPGTGER